MFEMELNNHNENESMKELLSDKMKNEELFSKGKKINCTIFLIICGIINLTLGFLSIKYDYLELIIRERIRMRPGLPPFEYWRNPPAAQISLTIFNYTNLKEFMDGEASKFKLEEIGPIIYNEIVEQTDFEFHNNSTLSYTTLRKLKFIPENNELGILNKTITVPNPILLNLVGYFQNKNSFTKFGFKLISNYDNIAVTTTVYNLLWNFTTPVFRLIRTLAPFLVERENGGILFNAFYPIRRRYNIHIGPGSGFKNFGKMNTFNDNHHIPGFENEYRNTCHMSLQNATDGANNPPYLTRQSEIILWREFLCRTIPLTYEEDINKNGILAYKFVVNPNVFDRLDNRSMDCYKSFDDYELPNGLFDSSKCAFNLPVAGSLPHFYGRSGKWNDQLEGIRPNKTKHITYAVIEPSTGLPLEGCARLQSNIILPKLTGFNQRIQKFSDMIIPTFWIELSLTDLPPHMLRMTKFIVNIVPILQPIMIVIFLSLGSTLTVTGFFNIMRSYKINICCITSPSKHLIARTYIVANKEKDCFLSKIK